MPAHVDDRDLVELPPRRCRDRLELVACPGASETQYGSFALDSSDGKIAAEIMLGYRRSHDFNNTKQPGQDFAIVAGDAQCVVGVVADGVSQSFYGNLAAKHVSMWLSEELWRSRLCPPQGEELEQELKKQELILAEVVKGYSLEHLPSWHRTILEAIRTDAGSQAVFAAFVYDIQARRLHLYQAGDISAILHCHSKEALIFQADPKGRWSTSDKSRLLLATAVFKDVDAIVLKSDGAGDGWGRKLGSNTFNKDAFLQLSRDRADYDDVSFVAVILAPQEAVPIPESSRPDRWWQNVRVFGVGAALGFMVPLAVSKTLQARSRLRKLWKRAKHASEGRKEGKPDD